MYLHPMSSGFCRTWQTEVYLLSASTLDSTDSRCSGRSCTWVTVTSLNCWRIVRDGFGAAQLTCFRKKYQTTLYAEKSLCGWILAVDPGVLWKICRSPCVSSVHVALVQDSQNSLRPQDNPNVVSSSSGGLRGQSEVRLRSEWVQGRYVDEVCSFSKSQKGFKVLPGLHRLLKIPEGNCGSSVREYIWSSCLEHGLMFHFSIDCREGKGCWSKVH